jgi:hypothetical protein
MLKRQWFVVRNNYIVKRFETLARAESFVREKGWSEDREDVSIVCYDRER